MHRKLRKKSLENMTGCNSNLEMKRRTINEKNSPTLKCEKKRSFTNNNVKFKKKERNRLCEPNTMRYGKMHERQQIALIISHETEADFVRSFFINSTPSVPTRLIRLKRRAASINCKINWNKYKHSELYSIAEENRRDKNGLLHFFPKSMIGRNEILFKIRKKVEESIKKDSDREPDINDQIQSENTAHAKMKVFDLQNSMKEINAVKSSANISLASANAGIVESKEFTSKSPLYSSK
jgi:hypothetical protein